MRTRDLVAVGVGITAPAAMAAALIPARDQIGSVNVALILAVVVVAVAAWGQRLAAFIAAASAAVFFDVLHTRPTTRSPSPNGTTSSLRPCC